MFGPIRVPRKPRKPPLARPLAPGQSATRRTAVANGNASLPPEGNPNSWWGRRRSEILTSRVNDLGGMDVLSENRWSLARHLTFLDTELDAMAAQRSNGEEVDMEVAAAMVGQLCRGLKVLGLDRVQPMREVNPIEAAFSAPPQRGEPLDVPFRTSTQDDEA